MKLIKNFFIYIVLIVSFYYTSWADEKPIDVKYHDNGYATANVRDFGDFSSPETVGSFLEIVLQFFISIIGGIALLGIILGGIMVMMGGASESTKEHGKEILLYSLIGLGVSMLSMVIVTFVQSFVYSLGT
jgi:hypothetical protein